MYSGWNRILGVGSRGDGFRGSAGLAGPLRPYGSCRGEQSGHPDQIVGGHCEGELEAHARQPTQLDLGKARNCLAPAEGFLDELAFALARFVAFVPRGAPVNGRPLGLSRNMRRRAFPPEIGNEIGTCRRL